MKGVTGCRLRLLQCWQLPDKKSRDITRDIWHVPRCFRMFLYLFYDSPRNPDQYFAESWLGNGHRRCEIPRTASAYMQHAFRHGTLFLCRVQIRRSKHRQLQLCGLCARVWRWSYAVRDKDRRRMFKNGIWVKDRTVRWGKKLHSKTLHNSYCPQDITAINLRKWLTGHAACVGKHADSVSGYPVSSLPPGKYRCISTVRPLRSLYSNRATNMTVEGKVLSTLINLLTPSGFSPFHQV